MIVRVVTCEAGSTEAAEEWHRQRAAAVENVVGLQRVDFVRQSEPPRAGAIMYFESLEDLRAYENFERYDRLQESMQESWITEEKPVRDSAYRLMETSETPPGRR